MIDVALPDGPTEPVVRSFAACLASAAEVDLAQLPVTDGDLAAAVRTWRTWLASRGAGLVPIEGAARFSWPGYWIAVLEDEVVLAFGTPPGVVLSPQAPELLGRATADLPVRAGYVLASLDAALPAHAPPVPLTGLVEALAIAEHAKAPMRLVASAHALAGRGLEGDRYAVGAGTFTPRTTTTSDPAGRGYALTFVAAEVLDDVRLPGAEGALGPAAARRNVVTRGIDLDALIGRHFMIGGVQCFGQRRCEPCAHLERLTAPGVLRGLIHRGGLRADVLTDGLIRVGDPVRAD